MLWEEQVTTLALLNVTGRELSLFDFFFFEKYTSCACLLGSGLNCIFPWKVQLLITCKSLFNTICDLYLSQTCEKRDVLSTKIHSQIECCPVNHYCILETKENEEQSPVLLQILSTPKKRSDYKERLFLFLHRTLLTSIKAPHAILYQKPWAFLKIYP